MITSKIRITADVSRRLLFFYWALRGIILKCFFYLKNRTMRFLNTDKKIEYSFCMPLTSEYTSASIVIEWVQKLELKLQVVGDSKFRDEIEAQKLVRADAYFENSGRIIETGYHNFCAQVQGNWIFRLDSDEIPSAKLVENLKKIDLCKNEIVGIHRVQVIYLMGDFFILDDPNFKSDRHIQFRIFNKKRVQFYGDNAEPHTPGFKMKELTKVVLPKDNLIYHLDFCLKGFNERKSKSKIYEDAGQRDHMRIVQLGPTYPFSIRQIEDSEVLQYLRSKQRHFVPYPAFPELVPSDSSEI